MAAPTKEPSTESPFYVGKDFYVPSFDVKVGEKPLDRAVIRNILSVNYKDSLTEIDSFDITINNWDAKNRTFKYSDGDLFAPGQKIELWMGYYAHIGDKGGLKLMLTGEITSLKPSFPAQGQPTLVISGVNVLHSLRKKQVSKAYPNMTDNEISQQIAGRLGIKIDTKNGGPAETIRYPYLLQKSQYDVLFLMSRANRIGYELFVEEEDSKDSNSSNSKRSERPSKLIFKPSTDMGTKVFDLKYGLTLIEFSPELTTANQVGKVTVKGWDAVRKQPISATVTRADLKTAGVKKNKEKKMEKSIENREEIITNKPVNSYAEAKQLAKETLQRIAKECLKGSGSVVGLPDLRTGCSLNLLGMGDRFNGRYFVTSTTHSIGDGGYITRFECRREEL